VLRGDRVSELANHARRIEVHRVGTSAVRERAMPPIAAVTTFDVGCGVAATFALTALDLDDNEESFVTRNLGRKRSAATGAEVRRVPLRLLDRRLDIGREVLQPAHDNQFLEPAGDVHLAVVELAEIAGA
jgi:hypothetical protein